MKYLDTKPLEIHISRYLYMKYLDTKPLEMHKCMMRFSISKYMHNINTFRNVSRVDMHI